MLTIKVLGPGCANCKKLEELTRQAIAAQHVDAEIIKVTDMQEIIAYDVIKTPGLVINEKLVSSGRIPSPATIEAWIKEAAWQDKSMA